MAERIDYLVAWDGNLFLEACECSYDVEDGKAKIPPMTVRWTSEWRAAKIFKTAADAAEYLAMLHVHRECEVMKVTPMPVEAEGE